MYSWTSARAHPPFAEILFRQRDQLLPVVIARHRQHGALGAIHSVAIGHQPVARKGAHVVRRAKDRPGQRLIAILRGHDQLAHQILRLVLGHGDLLQHHAALLGQLLLVECGMDHHVAEHVHRQLGVLVDHLGVIAGTLLGREGVQLAAHRVHDLGDLARRALLRALEEHMLEEVAQAVLLARLILRSGGDPHAHRHRAKMRQTLADERQAVR